MSLTREQRASRTRLYTDADSPAPEGCPGCKSPLEEWQASSSFCPTCRFPLVEIAGKYRLTRLLSESGFSRVYQAEHVHLSEGVRRIVKIIRPEMLDREDLVARFHREILLTATLSEQNPHIVRVFDDFGSLPHLGCFYVMEYLDGATVRELLRSYQGGLPLKQAAHLFGQLCEAMDVAHEAGVIHRDLKPENLMVIKQGRDADFLKVIDFGIARELVPREDPTLLTRGILGTPAYMSPEQCLNKRLDARSDVYAMGCILYELLTGRSPFAAQVDSSNDNPMLLIHAHIQEQPPPPSRFSRPQRPISPTLDPVLLKALAKLPKDRYDDVMSFFEAFDEILGQAQQYAERQRALVPLTPSTAYTVTMDVQSGPELLLETPEPPRRPAPAPRSQPPAQTLDAEPEPPSPQGPTAPGPSTEPPPGPEPMAKDPVPTTLDEPEGPHPAETLEPPPRPETASEPVASTGPEPSVSAKPARRWAWIGAGLLLGLGLWGGGAWWGQRSPTDPPSARGSKQPASVRSPAARRQSPPAAKARRAAPVATGAPDAGIGKPAKPPHQKPAGPQSSKDGSPTVGTVAKPGATPKPRSSKPRSRPPRRALRSKRPGWVRLLKGCPKRPLRWAFLSIARGQMPGVRLRLDGGDVVRRPGGYCVGWKPPQSQRWLKLDGAGIVPCILPLRRLGPTQTLELLEEGQPEPSSQGYCLP